MSLFNELLPKLNEISNTFVKNIYDDLEVALESLDKFEEEYLHGKGQAREKDGKEKKLMTTLQSIDEDEVEVTKSTNTKKLNNKSSTESESRSSRRSNKRSKNEVDDMSSPEQEKRQKRNASVKAQSIISKQVNVNLTQKMRRGSDDKSKNNKKTDDNKENTEPAPLIQIKQEKISLPPEPMDMASLPLDSVIKQEPDKDDLAMPPPMAPVPKARKGVVQSKSQESVEEETSTRRRTTRSRKQTDTIPETTPKQPEPAPPAPRPKRTRGRKKVSNADTENESGTPSQESLPASPVEKPRPKRTRRGKAAEKEAAKPSELEQTLQLKEERISQPDSHSPILPHKEKSKTKEALKTNKEVLINKNNINDKTVDIIQVNDTKLMDETRVIEKVGIDMDKTVVIANGAYSHTPVTPKDVRNINETMVLEACTQEASDMNKPAIMDATVIIEKAAKTVTDRNSIMTDDNSIMTDDNDEPQTPPHKDLKVQPTSAVKEKVQKFEELATRVTRTKTRAMARKDDDTENLTPPDKISKPILSAETLNKMNSMIFNGKTQISSSATKPRANIISSVKSFIPASTSKLSALTKAKEAAEECLKKEKEDARKKKEAILEAKRELQKKKREEKMAAAAAAREAAERERRAAIQAAAREKMEKQAHADLGKIERMREQERKKQELARKAAETEERRRAEEHARRLKLTDDQKKAEAARKKQLEEAEAMKKEAATMAKEIEKRQKEYIEKQKKKLRMENDKLMTPLKCHVEPVYMADGFQYLNSDEEAEPVERPIPTWCSSKARRRQLAIQSAVSVDAVDRLFGARRYHIDLRHIFPTIDHRMLHRTSSAVWRTPPH